MNDKCKYLCHMTAAEKHNYNVEYYRQNKDRWPKYRQGMTFGRMSSVSGQVRDAKWEQSRNQIDTEINKMQREQQDRINKMQEDANKPVEVQFKEQIKEARNFLNSGEFKKQLNQAVSFLKKNSGELIGLAKDFAKAFFSAWRS